MAKQYHGARHEVNDMVTRLKAQPPPPVPHRGPPIQEEKKNEDEKADEDLEMGEAEKGARESREGSEDEKGSEYEEGSKYGEEYGERSDDEDAVKATQPKQKKPSIVQQMRTPSPTPEPGPRPIKLSWCEANSVEVTQRARQWEVIEAKMDRWMAKARGTQMEKILREGHEEKEAARARRTKSGWVKRGLGEEQIILWAKAIKIDLTELDWECWIVRNITGEGGYRWYRLDMKDGETTKKLTYVGPGEEQWTKWGRRETREDKHGDGGEWR
ncbi:hypothetical protein Q9L58_001459 [Maublancomyces gigas]|uniref:Uncharacterized protein n=1 Tax=Discina gigas TaxID=1032678 RepID=A0ABR3GV26_9PEZI